MEKVEFYCDICIPNEFQPDHRQINDLKPLETIINSNYFSLILYDEKCENCKNLYYHLDGLNYNLQRFWFHDIGKAAIQIYNDKYVETYDYYILMSQDFLKMSHKNKREYFELISEEDFLNTIRPGTIFTQSKSGNKKFPIGLHSVSEYPIFMSPMCLGATGQVGDSGAIGTTGSEASLNYYDYIKQKIFDLGFTIREFKIQNICYFNKIEKITMTKAAVKKNIQ